MNDLENGPRIHVIHENGVWVEPLRDALADRDLPFDEWFLDEGSVDLFSAPPDGVYYNRISASSHTRDHRFAPELTAATLAWLERHGRRVVNGSRAVELEINKVKQYAALQAAGIAIPRTIAVVGPDLLVKAARRLGSVPFMVKPNRGGKGLGVQLYPSVDALEARLAAGSVEPPLDGTYLVQDYIQAPTPHIVRAEFIGGRFLYAVRVDTSAGFELCPADVCATDAAAAQAPAGPRFEIVDGALDRTEIAAYERFLAESGIEIAGVEFVRDASGRAFTYDVNTNTNYNPDAEAADGRDAGDPSSGMGAIAEFLGAELAALHASHGTEAQRKVA